MVKKVIVFFYIFFVSASLYPQVVYQHVSNIDIYDFLDELACLKVIQINSAIKPYSRIFIAQKLKEAELAKDKLTKRQQKELDFYLKDYNKELLFKKQYKKRLDLIYYKDTLFNFWANPIVGIQYYYNDSGIFHHRWNGAEANAYVGKNWGFYCSLRDNHESNPLSSPDFLTQQSGFRLKETPKGGVDYSEMRGGITYSNKWGTVALVKDHFVWGNNYNGSNIFSGHSPSFGQLKINVKPAKWFEFNYIHGWLASNVVDSLRSYNYANGKRLVYHDKQLSANMFSFTPFKYFTASIGNSIIYSDMSANLTYWIPLMFYKSIDHTYVTSNYGGGNSQMFIDISTRNLKYLHFYISGFVDELSISRMFKPTEQSNFFSAKAGLRITVIPNVSIIGEFTWTNPMVYKHFIPTTTYASGDYNIGHYLRDNTQEIFACVRYKPIRTLSVEFSYILAEKGNDYDYTGIGHSGLGLNHLQDIMWRNEAVCARVRYQIINDIYVFTDYTISNITGKDFQRYTPEVYQGSQQTVSGGMNIGF